MKQWLDDSLAVRHGERYVPVKECATANRPKPARPDTDLLGERQATAEHFDRLVYQVFLRYTRPRLMRLVASAWR